MKIINILTFAFSQILVIIDSAQPRKQSGGVGCNALLASFVQKPIPNTELMTGTFYQIRIKYPRHSEGGFITWASKTDKAGSMLAFSDYNNLGMYTVNGNWNRDTYWAFLSTDTPGWYHIINCGFPYKYLTWSLNGSLSHPEDINDYPVVIDENFTGKHVGADFLFRPIYQVQENGYLIESFVYGTISESSSSYSGKSYFLKLEPSAISRDTKESLFTIDKPLNKIVDAVQTKPLENELLYPLKEIVTTVMKEVLGSFDCLTFA